MLKPALQADARAAVEALAKDTAPAPPSWSARPGWRTGRLYNAVLLLDGGRVAGQSFKHDLPNYGVFDEKRVFAPGPHAGAVERARRAASACRSARTSGPSDVCECLSRDRGGNPGGAQRLAFRGGQGGCAPGAGGRRAWRNRPAADLSQPGRRPGRTGVRRRLLCAQCRPFRWPWRCRAWREQVTVSEWTRGANGKWLCAAGRTGAGREPAKRQSITP